MITQAKSPNEPLVDYPTRDGRPVGETPVHRDNLFDLIQVLRRYYAGRTDLYISGNMLMYYEPGDKRKHVSPDVFVALGVPDREREAYFTWIEGKGPDIVFEFTSRSTRREDIKKKFELYRDVLGVAEYYLFDPKQEYLKPSMKGYRLTDGEYVPIEPEDGRLPSQILGLFLERQDDVLRLYDPTTGAWVPTDKEAVEAAEAKAEAAVAKAEAAETKLRRAAELRAQKSEELMQNLLQELEELRRGSQGSS